MATMLRLLLSCSLAALLQAQAPAIPEPPKTDLPYLVMADSIAPTEVFEAKTEKKNEGKKNEETTYWVPGEHSTAKTPLASPIFALKQDTLAAERLSIYPFVIRNGRREITFSRKNATKPFTLTISKVGEAFVRMEVNESLPPGEYALTPSGSDLVYCFTVF